ncbi:MAG: hypothetical protein PQ963_06150 [Methanobacterium sp.]
MKSPIGCYTINSMDKKAKADNLEQKLLRVTTISKTTIRWFLTFV